MSIVPVQLRYLVLWIGVIAGEAWLARLGLGAWCLSKAQMDSLQFLKVFAIGQVYDLGFIAYAISPVLLYLAVCRQKAYASRIHSWFRRLSLGGLVAFFTFVLVAEFLFWDEFQVRFNFIAVDYLVYTHEVIRNIRESYPMPLIVALIFFMGLIPVMILGKLRRFWDEGPQAGSRLKLLFAGLAVMCPLVIQATLSQGLRSLFVNTYQRELASNGPYQFVAAFRNNVLNFAEFYPTLSEEKAGRLVSEQLHLDVRPDFEDMLHKVDARPGLGFRNVILIMVESLSADFMETFGNQKQLTSNLDNLVSHSVFFDQMYATGTRTTRGIEAVNLSLPPTPGRSIVKRAGKESDMISLGEVFARNGFATRFLYGGRGYFDNMNAFFLGNGYQDVVDQHNTAEEKMKFQNAWGMSDEDLLNQVLESADEMTAASQPFFFYTLTTSNHRPYTYPEGRVDIPSGTGRDGAVKYTDWALGNFLVQAEHHSWFQDTLFVIVADHQASSAGKVDLPLERYHIPLWFYGPAHLAPKRVKTVGSQIDIPVTLLGLLGLPYEAAFMGQDLLQIPEKDGRAFIGTYQSLGYFKNGDLAILRPRQEPVLHLRADSSHMKVLDSDVEDPLIQDAVAFYQVADAVYHQGFNRKDRWK